MSLDSQLRPEDEFFAVASDTQVEEGNKPLLPLVMEVSFCSVVGIGSLTMGIPDAYDLILPEKSYYSVQYAGTVIELIIGVTFSLAAIGAVLDYHALRRSTS